MLRHLPTPRTIDRYVFFSVLTESEREAVRKMMISHSIDIGDVRLFDLRRGTVVYTLFKTNDDGQRYVDDGTGEVAVRTERHKIKQDQRSTTMPAEQECQAFVGQTENIYALDEHGKQYAFEVIVTHVCSEMKNHPMPHQCGECGEAWGYLDAFTEEER